MIDLKRNKGGRYAGYPPLFSGKNAVLHRILSRGIRRNAEQIPLLKWGKGGLFRPYGGRGIPDTPPPPTRGGMIDFKGKGVGGIRITPHHDQNISSNGGLGPTLGSDQHY